MVEEPKKPMSQILREMVDEPGKPMSQILRESIEHNPRHYIELNIFGKEIRPCARCFGIWMGSLIGFILSSPFWLGYLYANNFALVFIIAWLFAIPALVDWSTVKLSLWEGSNAVRVVTGFLYGFGIIIYLFVLPASIIFRILTYALYEGVFQTFRIIHRFHHYKIQ